MPLPAVAMLRDVVLSRLVSSFRALGRADATGGSSREGALRAELAAAQTQLAAARERLRALERTAAERVAFALPDLDRPIEANRPGPIDPEAYRGVLRALEERCHDHPDDVDALVKLSDAYLLRPIGGSDGFRALWKALGREFNPDAAVEALERAARLDPDNPAIEATLANARVQATPPLLLAALPKSGSVFVFRGLIFGAGKSRIGSVHAGVFPNFMVCQGNLMALMRFRLASHTHLAPVRANLVEMGPRFNLDRMIVHVRDPRQALVSWYHFIRDIQQTEPTQGLHYGLPEDYLAMPPASQLEWQIEHYYPLLVQWIAGWLDASSLPWFRTRILYTRFEDMVTRPREFFDRILDFYDMDRSRFTYPEPPTVHGDRNFRRGEIDEWRRTLSPEQIERVSAAIPVAVYDRFGWPRR